MTAAVVIGILGVIGRIFLILLLVIAALLALLLFSPFTYRATVRKEEETTAVRARLNWLFSLLSLRVQMEAGADGGGKPETEVYLFGIPLLRLRQRRKADRDPGKMKNKKEGRRSASRAGKAYTGAKIRPSVTPRAERVQKEYPEIRPEIFHRRGPNFFLRFGAKISSVIGKIKRFFARLGEFLAFLRSEQFTRGARVLKREGLRVLKHLRPRRLRGRLAFGFEDPATTGRVLGGLGILYPVLPKKLSIEPDFEKKKLEADVEIGGHFFGIVLLVRALKIFCNKDVRALLRRFRSGKKSRARDTEKEKIRKAG